MLLHVIVAARPIDGALNPAGGDGRAQYVGDLLTLVDYAGNRHPTAEFAGRAAALRMPGRMPCGPVNDRSILFASYDVRIEIRQIAVGVIKPLCAHEVSLVVIHLHRGSSQRDRCAPETSTR